MGQDVGKDIAEVRDKLNSLKVVQRLYGLYTEARTRLTEKVAAGRTLSTADSLQTCPNIQNLIHGMKSKGSAGPSECLEKVGGGASKITVAGGRL